MQSSIASGESIVVRIAATSIRRLSFVEFLQTIVNQEPFERVVRNKDSHTWLCPIEVFPELSPNQLRIRPMPFGEFPRKELIEQ